MKWGGTNFECEGRAPLVPRWRRPLNGSFTIRNIVCRNYCIPQQIYSTEISKIWTNDLMKLLRQGEKLGRFTISLYICHTKAMTTLAEYGTKCLY